MTAPVLSVVLPTYNEAGNIAAMIDALGDALEGIPHELVVVDDDSPDGTAGAAEATGNARVVVRKQERGLGTAVVRGMREAQGKYVLVMDTDFQHPPEVAKRMVAKALAADADLVVGSRYADGGTEGDFGMARRGISRGAALLSRLALPPVREHKITDPMSGLFLVRRDRLDLDTLDPKGYKILLEVLARTPLDVVTEVGYRFDTRREGDSKLGAAVILQYLLHLALLGSGHPENRRILRFAAVGASGVVVNLGLLWLLTERVGWPPLASAAVSVEASIITNFLLDDRFTFHDRRSGRRLVRMGRFNLLSIGALAINLSTFFVLHNLMGIHYLVAEAVAIVVSFGANYLGNFHWTYGTADRVRARDVLRKASPWLPVLFLTVGAGFLFFDDLDRADEIYFDEHYYVSVAYQIHHGIWEDPCWAHDGHLSNRPVNFEHPPLAKLIIAWSVDTFGEDLPVFSGCRAPDGNSYAIFTQDLRENGDPYSWRGPSAVFGALTVGFAGLAAGRLFRNPNVGALTSAFVAMDGVILTSSRVAILDIFAAGFAMMALAAATLPGRRGILLSSVALGLGFACKYTVVFVGAPVLLVLLWTNARNGRLDRRFFDGSVAAFLLIPNWILISTYIPWWRIWVPEMGVMGAVQHWWRVLWEGITYGVGVQSGHDYGMPSYAWFSMAQPTFYYGMWNVASIEGLNRYIYAVGNPVLWWAAASAVIAIGAGYLLSVRRTQRAGAGLWNAMAYQPAWLQRLGIAALLPALTYAGFLALSRETFMFYTTILVPLLAIPLAGLMVLMWNSGRMVGRIGVPVLLMAIVAAFLHYYPITAGIDLRAERFDHIIDTIPWMRP